MRWLFLDRVEEIQAGRRAVGLKLPAMSEDYFVDHFPTFPVVPGVIIVEALAQLSGKLLEVSLWEERGFWVWPILSIVQQAKFRHFVRPGQPITLVSKAVSIRNESAAVNVVAQVEGKRICNAELMFVFDPDGLETEEAQFDLEKTERLALKNLWIDYPEWAERTEVCRNVGRGAQESK